MISITFPIFTETINLIDQTENQQSFQGKSGIIDVSLTGRNTEGIYIYIYIYIMCVCVPMCVIFIKI